jgi:hypothetical protein
MIATSQKGPLRRPFFIVLARPFSSEAREGGGRSPTDGVWDNAAPEAYAP